ncbi:MAG TPA: hypothetical protein PLI09_06005 [Candidatus Hydrogenedentes bacterium]|nr:hypothetical protein [Candidatus Hydrogenedentota bacterium]
MKKTEKEFDCVEMMHAGALRIYEETKDMTNEEEMEYWRRKNEEARQKFPQMREAAQANTSPG